MAKTYYDELTAILVRHGCTLVRHGRHAIWRSPINNRTFSVPASKSRHTANEVLKQAGISERMR